MANSLLDIATMINDVIDELQSPEKENLEKLKDKLSTIEDSYLALHDPTARTRHLVNVQDALSNLLELVEKLAAVESWQTKIRITNIELSSRIKNVKIALDDVDAKSSSPPTNQQENSNAKVTGREEEKKKITQQLLSNTNITILPIVGIGGIGKTALAKLVYDDAPFGLKVWVDRGESFNRESIIEKLTKSEQNHLSEANSERRYLVVLDDVKSADPKEWCEFREFLPPQGTIVITTRSHLISVQLFHVKSPNL